MSTPTNDLNEFRTILGIRFFVGSLERLLARARQGGLIVVPAAPALAELGRDLEYRQALEKAAFAIVDSSYLTILWFFRKGEVLTRISGLQFMRGLVEDADFRRVGATYWVMPSSSDLTANLKWLEGRGISVSPDHCYIAPHYGKGRIQDEELVRQIEALKPPYVVINIGGGTQEVLGSVLAARLSYSPAIICTGAAIAFLSGRQARIHPWVDKIMLAWLARCVSEPRKFIPRYVRGLVLVQLLFKFADRPVPIAGRA